VPTSDPALPDAPLVPGWANRTPLLLGLIVVMQLAFIASYVGALHHPDPEGVPLGVVAPEAVFTTLSEQVGAATDAVVLVEVADADTARNQVESGELHGAVLFGDAGPSTDTLVVTGVPSIAYETLFREVLDQVDDTLRQANPSAARGYTVDVVNAFPDEDPQGLTPFYLAIGWVVGGYLLLAFFGFTQRSAHGWDGIGRRLMVLVGYAAVSGTGGALIVGPLLGIVGDHLVQLAIFGAALSLAVTATVQALELLAGPIWGIGAAIVLYVVIGNPSAGGPFPRSFGPSAFEAIGGWLPPGMGVDGIRAVVYGTSGLSGVVWRLLLYIVVGLGTCLAVTALGERRRHAP
jgi:hypothetical protein